jgi:hypothetical protein
MELDNALQIPSELLQQQHFDAFISVSGYESRCTYLASKIDLSAIPEKLVLAYTEMNHCLYRDYNDDQFKAMNFVFYEVVSNDTSRLPEILDSICLNNPKKSLNILIDYSSMSKGWYQGIINYFCEIEDILSNVNLFFTYSPSEYSKVNTDNLKYHFDPKLPVEPGLKPVALILGLGYEKGKSEELARQLKSEATFAFYADPAVDQRFVKDVLENNHELLNRINKDQIIRYPIFDLNSINSTLTKLCVNLRISHQLVLAPIGPKPFTLMCFILSARYPDIKIWRVSSSETDGSSDRKPHGEMLVYKVIFTSEEIDY